MDFLVKFQQYSDKVEKWLQDNLQFDLNCLERTVYESMKYSLTAGGKRLRPVLSLAVCDMLNLDEEKVLPFACAIELIHTYSLIHDDLPCMDNSDFRRGKPTNHKVFGEAMAVLAGDGLLNLAFEIMLNESIKEENNSLYCARAAKLIADASGTKGMIGGQVIDIEAVGKKITYDELCQMHKKKTGALIKASILMPARLFNVPDEITESLEIYAESLGLAFQIKDDILDVEGNSQIVGKPVGTDEKNDKSTFVTLLGLNKAKALLKESTQRAADSLKNIDNSGFLTEMACWIAERNK
ncbi:MAG: polyprenyl synthetase family protein [Clostridiaceae bacterium]|nr:polyprenyl synthetase family protein [Clostridiaceae bacterium]